MSTRRLAINGIELSFLDEGEGDAIVLCHGFPELGYSWRHQVPLLVDAGYRVLVPDMRGYGASSAPADPTLYDVLTLCDDICGLLDAVGEEAAVAIGHDWGASVVWHLAQIHPERVRAVAGLSVPFVPRAPAPPIEILRANLGEDFYLVWFQEPGAADAAFGRDVRAALTSSMQWARGWEPEPYTKPPPWQSEEELAVYVDTFSQTGFTGGLNWYRNIDRNWELTEPYAQRRIEQPALFITGEKDRVRTFMPAEAMEGWVTDLRDTIVVPGAGHWIQQQAPEVVNEALLDFLAAI